jgi:hypothetical protein
LSGRGDGFAENKERQYKNIEVLLDPSVEKEINNFDHGMNKRVRENPILENLSIQSIDGNNSTN